MHVTTLNLGNFTLTTTWKNLNPNFVSAWDKARAAYGAQAFDALSRDEQIQAVRDHIRRK